MTGLDGAWPSGVAADRARQSMRPSRSVSVTRGDAPAHADERVSPHVLVDPTCSPFRQMAMRTVLVLLACCALLVACQQAGAMSACPAVDSPQGVIFVLPAGGHIEKPVEVRACVERDCVIDDLTSPRVSTPWIVAGAAEATAGRSVWARLTITELGSRKVRFNASTRVAFRATTAIPCAPDVSGYQASVVATADGGLVPG
jgi:hypothetical protein